MSRGLGDVYKRQLYVPTASIDDYKAATSWKEFTIIKGVETTSINGVENNNDNTGKVYYNLQGIRISANNITPGVYIIREGAKTTKAYVSAK